MIGFELSSQDYGNIISVVIVVCVILFMKDQLGNGWPSYKKASIEEKKT
jgi:hypothetical protein